MPGSVTEPLAVVSGGKEFRYVVEFKLMKCAVLLNIPVHVLSLKCVIF